MDPSVLDFIKKQNQLSECISVTTTDIFKQSMEVHTLIDSLSDTLPEKELLKKAIQNQMMVISKQKNFEVESVQNLESAMSDWKNKGLVS